MFAVKMNCYRSSRFALITLASMALWSCLEPPKKRDPSARVTWEDYTPSEMAKWANEFIALGEHGAYARIEEIARHYHPWTGDNQDVNDSLWLLCRAVWGSKPRSGGLGLPPPIFGAMSRPWGSLNPADWPMLPMVVVSNAPFLIPMGISGAGGLPESGLSYLRTCRAHGEFRAAPYSVLSKTEASQALDSLFQSERWARIEWGDISKVSNEEWIRAQVRRMQ